MCAVGRRRTSMRGRSATGAATGLSTIRVAWRRLRGSSAGGRGRTLRGRWPCSITRWAGCAAIGLLPGVTVLARQVAAAREAAEARLYEVLAAAARQVDPGLPHRLAD